MIRRQKKGDQTRLTFALPHDAQLGPVSVVGDFIDWTPGTWVLHVPLPEPSRGVPDLMLVKPGLPPLLVEVKTPDGRLSPEQRGWHARYGRCSAVCRSVEDAVVAMTQWEARYANTSAT